ncbi:DUF817 domain-containing protein [Blastococcus xanthinilyticus]|uniref:Uncharacterized membrane protein YoaT (DUF817 family) n=1 Tax=Blastococcus xanthinilyticus TaxID=1564164 RepID=A0A5S5CMP1_9ACTN|nr:DUF817 domain-containing protein [Blastococcus xanthinilyticus]TYP83665.1 uncharacterized membrane protein YoaT (DUF817 family) [Blastococcus xanthinilyticus]
MRQLLRFAWVEAQCCLFAVLFFLGLALVRLVPLPIDPADALLIWCLGVTLLLWLARWETGREVAVIFGFHLVGLVLELYKVAQGSWSYPDTGLATVGGVPLYSGFMYAAVGSYVCQAWRRFDLRISGYRARSTAAVAALVYLNFFASHVTVDVRLVLAIALLVVTRRTYVHFTVGRRRYAMPMALSFVLIGFFLWVAENAATLLRAWQYPSQESVWTLVHAAKLGSWSLLVVVSIVLVAAVKAFEGRLYGTPEDLTVLRAFRAGRDLPPLDGATREAAAEGSARAPSGP